MKQEKQQSGLWQRWLRNLLSIVLALGLAAAMGITAFFAARSYHNLEADMRCYAKTAADFFASASGQSHEDFIRTCGTYAQAFETRDGITLQFITAQGELAASSDGETAQAVPQTEEIAASMESLSTEAFMGRDPALGRRVMAISVPMICGDGETVGVLRYVASVRTANRQIALVALICVAAVALLAVLLTVVSYFYLHTILTPLAEITAKAKRIAGGSYGAQIETKYNDEIGELAKTINEMSVQINQNEKTQTEFISSLSHELRTPLTAINGWGETILSSDVLDEEQTRRGMQIIMRETRRLTEMVVELLDFTRIQDGRMTLNIEPTDIRGEFEDTVYMYGSRLRQDGIELKYMDNDDDIPEIPCDPKRMRQVFLNILDNAAKHGGEGKRIDTAMTFEDGCVVVRIRDFGPGIPEDEIPLVKKKFYKGSSKARGSGIGLAVCDEIVQMHGGTLTLENAGGGGTLVTLRLPADE